MTRAPSLFERLERKARRSIVRMQGQRVLAILGMHRSGTSSLAGSLEQAGLHLGDGDVAGKGKWNAKGNRESGILMRLHEDVLRSSGGSWDRPPDEVAWTNEQRHIRDQFIRSRSTQPYWGFKDPRTILLVDGWLEAIPDMSMVATIRHPIAVARSLGRRAGDDDPDRWLGLWLEYNERLLRLQEARGFPVIDFDLSPDDYQERLRSVIVRLGLRVPSREPDFFEPSLRNSEPAGMELPATVADVYRRLCEIAVKQAGALAARPAADRG